MIDTHLFGSVRSGSKLGIRILDLLLASGDVFLCNLGESEFSRKQPLQILELLLPRG